MTRQTTATLSTARTRSPAEELIESLNDPPLPRQPYIGSYIEFFATQTKRQGGRILDIRLGSLPQGCPCFCIGKKKKERMPQPG
jgi:hypothetical protein